MNKKDGSKYAPKGKPNPVVKPGGVLHCGNCT